METRRRRQSDRYEILDRDHAPVPDYSMFQAACDDAGKELGLDGRMVSSVYKRFINHSLTLMFPDGDPKYMTDEELLSKRRILRIPFIGAMEVTAKALRHWRKAEAMIKNKQNNQDYA